MPDQKYIDDFRKELNELGEDAVRTKIASREWSAESAPTKLSLATEFLKSKEDTRTAATEAKRDVREEDILAIAREANRLASDANSVARIEAAAAARSSRWAMYAAIIAVIGAAVASKDEILRLIFGHH